MGWTFSLFFFSWVTSKEKGRINGNDEKDSHCRRKPPFLLQCFVLYPFVMKQAFFLVLLFEIRFRILKKSFFYPSLARFFPYFGVCGREILSLYNLWSRLPGRPNEHLNITNRRERIVFFFSFIKRIFVEMCSFQTQDVWL